MQFMSYVLETEIISCMQISAEFRNLDKCYRDVIQEITERMANGMCKYLECSDVNSLDDWNEVGHIHYVI